MSNSKPVPKLLSGMMVVARSTKRLFDLRRIRRYVPSKWKVEVDSLVEAEVELMKREPETIIIDVSDFSSGEFQASLGKFSLQIPGWVKVFFVDSNPTPSRIRRAAELGVHGVLKAPLSYSGLSHLLQELGQLRPSERNVERDDLQEHKKGGSES